jgi:hypothetical protein
MCAPVFLLSCARSGSTLLRVMLAGHTGLFCPPELNLLPFETMAERAAKLGECRMERYREVGLNPAQGLERALMELEGIDAEQSRRHIEQWNHSGESTASVYSILGDLAKPRRLVDKSPFYTASAETLKRAERLFSNPLYLYLFRHPYSVIESLVRNRYRPGPTRDLTHAAESLWARANSNIIEFLSAIEPERQTHVRYEELVREPADVMGRLCLFLGIPFQEAALNPYEGQRMTDGIGEGLAALGDIDFRRHDGIDAQLGDCWRRIRLPRPLTVAIPIARSMGYELPAQAHTVAVRC